MFYSSMLQYHVQGRHDSKLKHVRGARKRHQTQQNATHASRSQDTPQKTRARNMPAAQTTDRCYHISSQNHRSSTMISSKALWKKFSEAQRVIRMQHTPIHHRSAGIRLHVFVVSAQHGGRYERILIASTLWLARAGDPSPVPAKNE